MMTFEEFLKECDKRLKETPEYYDKHEKMLFSEIKQKFENEEITIRECENLLDARVHELSVLFNNYTMTDAIITKDTYSLRKELNEKLSKEQIAIRNKKIDELHKNFFKSTCYDELINCNNYYDEIKQQFNTKQQQKSPWIQDLIDKGCIKPDGKTTIKGLNEIAREIRRFTGIRVSSSQLEGFINKKTGKPYPTKTLENAVYTGNTTFDI